MIRSKSVQHSLIFKTNGVRFRLDKERKGKGHENPSEHHVEKRKERSEWKQPRSRPRPLLKDFRSWHRSEIWQGNPGNSIQVAMVMSWLPGPVSCSTSRFIEQRQCGSQFAGSNPELCCPATVLEARADDSANTVETSDKKPNCDLETITKMPFSEQT